MVIATALGWGDVASIALAVTAAFFFGYTLTSVPLLRSGLSFAAVARPDRVRGGHGLDREPSAAR
jgi:hypothetical protein